MDDLTFLVDVCHVQLLAIDSKVSMREAYDIAVRSRSPQRFGTYIKSDCKLTVGLLTLGFSSSLLS
jgi:hypothetical protein